jgi:hypothetical protein
MKKFKKVIDDGGVYGSPISVNRRPVFRSSAIFPVLKNKNFNSRILFMGYWILKREIQEVSILYTLRKHSGEIISRKTILINSPRSQVLEICDILPAEIGDLDFMGSLELEVFSTRDMVFPFPAFVLEYYGKFFSTCVHTTGRIFNDFEDFNDTADLKVAESGFDLRSTRDIEPFFAFVNGPVENDMHLDLEFINSRNQSANAVVESDPIKPYETKYVFIKKYFPDFDVFLNNRSGTVKIKHDFKGFFPRFLAGNINRNKWIASITHTFYDCSKIDQSEGYWVRESEVMYDCSVFTPVFLDQNRFTDIIVYPVFSPSEFQIDLSLFDQSGECLLKLHDILKIDGIGKYDVINVNEFVIKNKLDKDEIKGALLTGSWSNGSKIPSRLKFGLNVGVGGTTESLASNICFAADLGIGKTLQKKGTRKWAPILNKGEACIVVTNSSTLKKGGITANIKYKIFRESDDSFLEYKSSIPAHGQLRISPKHSFEINEFLQGQPGWVYIDSDNPFVNAWYFNFSESGVVAADHSF